MLLNKNLKNNRIIIKDILSNTIIADTKVLRYEWATNSVIISAMDFNYKGSAEVIILIFGETGLFQFNGKSENAMVANEKYIRLYNGKEKESRLHERYDFFAKGQIESLHISNQEIQLRTPINITTQNISTNGILFQSMTESLKVKDSFYANIKLNSHTILMQCQVVRTQNLTLSTEEYGCSIIKCFSTETA